MNFPRYVTIRSRRCRSCLELGLGMSRIASIFVGSGFTPWSENTFPRKTNSVYSNRHFFTFSLSPAWCILSKTVFTLASCCSLSLPHIIRISSCTFAQPSKLSMISVTFFWNTLLALSIPNGRRLNLYRPNGVLNVRSLELCSSTLICH